MGFYGNITTTSKTQFNFDRTYSNRKEMDDGCSTDGVYAGRFVLINYDSGEDVKLSSPSGFYYCADNGNMYLSAITTDNYEVVMKDDSIVTTANIGDKNTLPIIVRVSKENYIYGISTEKKYVELVANQKTISKSDFLDNDDILLLKQKSEFEIIDNIHVVNNSIKEDIAKDGIYEINANCFYYTEKSSEESQSDSLKTSSSIHNYFYFKGIKGESLDEESNEIIWTEINPSESEYLLNFNIDIIYYGGSRGYDSTVWQKVYTEGNEKYVMIAELNSVVPTFDMSADAPSLIPLTPHFDANSTNVYYKLHWQPQWGFRVKAASNKLTTPRIELDGTINEEDNTGVKVSSDGSFYPSDEVTIWKSTFYNPNPNEDEDEKEMTELYYNINGSWQEDKSTTGETYVPAAIYYNKSGFDASHIEYSEDLTNEKSSNYNPNINTNVSDSITVSPTGISGYKYKNHDSTIGTANDIQEISIMLPSIGNIMAQIWDLVYGGRDTNNDIKEGNYETGYERDKRNQDIYWEDGGADPQRKGLRLYPSLENGGIGYSWGDNESDDPDNEVATIAGIINSVHDLMGMIIVKNIPANDKLDSADPDKIYYDPSNKMYCKLQRAYEWTDIDTVEARKDGVYLKEYEPGTKYFTNDVGNYLYAEDEVARYQAKYYYNRDEDWVNIAFNADYSPNTFYYTGTQEVENSITKENDSGSTITTETTYLLETNDSPRTDRNYVTIKVTVFDGEEDPDTGAKHPEKRYFYRRNKYYIYTGEDTAETEVDINNFEKDTGVYTKEVTKYDKDGNIVYIDENGNETIVEEDAAWDLGSGEKVTAKVEQTFYGLNPSMNYYIIQSTSDTSGVTFKAVDITNRLVSVNYTNPDTMRFYKVDGQDYVLITEDDEIVTTDKVAPVTCRTIQIDQENLSFYLKGRYYKKDKPSAAHPNGQGYLIDRNSHFDTDYNYQKELRSIYYTSSEIGEDGSIQVYETANGYTTDVAWLQRMYDHDGKTLDLDKLLNDNNGDEPNYTSLYTTKLEEAAIDPESDLPVIAYQWVSEYYEKVSEPELVTPYFYVPNKYYLYSTGELATGDYIDGAETSYIYCTKSNPCVHYDANGYLQEGAEWNMNITDIPEGVQLGYKDDKGYEPIELVDFARNLNTVHGLILRLNQIINSDDAYSRDTTTVYGTINKLNDIIAKFTEVMPGETMIVDEYGRIHGATKTSKQVYGYNNIGNGESNASASNEENQYIVWDIDTDKESPNISITHAIAHDAGTTATTADLNGKTGLNGLNKTDSAKDTLQLYTPIVDNAGHIVGKNTETVTLPYGFKYITLSAQSNAVTNPTANAAAATLTADNTQDTITINTGNKWIRMSNSDTSGADTLTIGHEVHSMTSGAANTQYGLTADKTIADIDGNTNQFTVPTFKFDEAGHFLMSEDHTITLPDNFTKITTSLSTGNTFTSNHSAASIEADTMTDELTFVEGNKWINLIADATNDKITIEHAAAGTASVSKGDTTNQTPSFGDTFKVLSASIDEAGHVKSLDEHTVTLHSLSLTNGTGNVVTGISLTAADGSFTETKANIGSILITGYSKQTAVSLSATDNLNTALGKLEGLIEQETTNRTSAIEGLDGVITGSGFVESISETDGVVTASLRALTTDDIPSLDASKITSGTFDTSRIPGLSATKITSGTLDADRIPSLSASKIGSDTFDVARIPTLTLEKISDAGTMAAENKDDYAKAEGNVDSSTTFSYTVGTETTQQLTIAQLVTKIAELEERIKELEGS